MRYISSAGFGKYSVRDTEDGTSQSYAKDTLLNMVKSGQKIYGTEIVKNSIKCHIMKLDQTVDRDRLVELLSQWSRKHNRSGEMLVANYLASLKLGTELDIVYVCMVSDGTHSLQRMHIKKAGMDRWLFKNSCQIHEDLASRVTDSIQPDLSLAVYKVK